MGENEKGWRRNKTRGEVCKEEGRRRRGDEKRRDKTRMTEMKTRKERENSDFRNNIFIYLFINKKNLKRGTFSQTLLVKF